MASDDWPDWLPADWTVQINKVEQRKVKCYVDSQGHKCYSKPQVYEYLRKMGRSIPNENNDNGDGSTVDLSVGANAPNTNELPESSPGEQLTLRTPRSSRRKSKPTGGSSSGDGSPPEPLSSQGHLEDSSWLPDGWTVEVKTRITGSSIGKKFKCYTDPLSGQKFFSKPQVLDYLAKINGSDVKKNNSEKKTASARLSSDFEVVSRTPVEGLPPGWIKELRLRKHGVPRKTDPYYLDPLSEYVFFSKKDALRYLESGNVKSCVMRPLKRDMSKDSVIELPNDPVTELNSNGSGIENQTPINSITGGDLSTPNTSRKEVRSISGGTFSSPKEEISKWLPDGWVVEEHSKATGQKYKIFKETATGKKLYSKPQVIDYLNGGSSYSTKRKENNSVESDSSQDHGSRPKRSITKKGIIKKNSDFEEVITTCAADGLPPGWIKELRTKIYATHKRNDPFYTDPETGYIFRSKLDALRFLDTGDVNLCAIRPKVKDKDGNEVNVYSNAVQKPTDTTNGKQLFEGENSSADITSTKVTRVSNRIIKRNNDSPTTLPARSSKRQKGSNPEISENVAVEENQGSGVNLEKQPDDDGRLCYDIPEDDNWTDQCIEFAVKTLTNEITFIGQPTASVGTGFQQEGVAANAGAVDPTGANETPTKAD